MKMLFMSDTHDNVEIAKDIAKVFEEKGAEAFIHCGDIVSGKMVEALKDAGLKNGIFIQGNMDKPNLEELKKAIENAGFQFVGENSEIKFEDEENKDNFLAYVTHGDNALIIEEAVRSGKFEFIFHGHTHKKNVKSEGKTTIINIGALSKDTPEDEREVLILDTVIKKFEFVKV